MKTKRRTRYLWLIVPILIAALLWVTTNMQRAKYCTGITVLMEDQGSSRFLSENDVIQHLKKLNGPLEGKNTIDIDVAKLEQQIMEMPFVARADVYFTLHGMLKIRMQQRKVIARLFDTHNSSVYLSNDGTIMPVTTKHNQRVLIISGEILDSLPKLIGRNISQLPSTQVLREVFDIATFLAADSVLNALIAQVYVNKQKELELIPTIDDHVVILGDAKNLDYKFRKLMAFYKKGMARTGWDTYAQINVKYSNQVVCTNKP